MSDQYGHSPAEILGTGTMLYHVRQPVYVGQLVVVHKQGKFRRARITRLGPKRVEVTWSTAGRREARVPREQVYETNDGALSGGELAGVIRANSAYGSTGQHLERAVPA